MVGNAPAQPALKAHEVTCMYRIPLALCLTLLMPASVLADEGPAFDCTKADSSTEEMICADTALGALDRRLAARYAEALKAVRGLDAGAQAAEQELRATQRGWIKGRDDCWKAEDQRACIEFAYLSREGELVSQWMLQSPTARAFWACGGNPANEVVTMFFDTALPSLRFERGDSIDTGVLTRSASGARYEGSFGRSIWIKGDSAAYRDPDPDGGEYTCTLVGQE